jgi:hypothetical protein
VYLGASGYLMRSNFVNGGTEWITGPHHVRNVAAGGGAEIDAPRGARRRRGRGSGRLVRLVALAAVVPLFASGCGNVTAQPAAVAAAAKVPMSIAIEPATSSTDVLPNAELTVRGTGGRLTDVQVLDSEGDFVDGYYDVNRTDWTATENLTLGEEYSVYAVGEGATGTVRESTTFTTLDPPAKERLGVAYVAPADGSTVGIAQPPSRASSSARASGAPPTRRPPSRSAATRSSRSTSTAAACRWSATAR